MRRERGGRDLDDEPFSFSGIEKRRELKENYIAMQHAKNKGRGRRRTDCALNLPFHHKKKKKNNTE